MDTTQAKGNSNELESMLRFIRDGYDCSIPFGNSAKYDFIVDINGHLYKMQNKCACYSKRSDTGEIDYGSIIIHCISQTTNTQKTVRHPYTKDQIDYFTTTFDGKTYIIPVEECSDRKTLRLTMPLSGITNYNWADDYLYENVIDKLINGTYKSMDKNEVIEKNRERKRIVGLETKPYKDPHNKGKANISLRKVERPDKETLSELIKEYSFLELGRKYNVSDNAIRKWCKFYGLPYRKKELE